MLAAGALWAGVSAGALTIAEAEVDAGSAATEDWRLYDGGVRFGPAELGDGPLPLELAIDYFSTGSPPVKWSNSRAVVSICTHQVGRPSSVSAELFRDAVRQGAELWNTLEAAVVYDYMGDCTHASTWSDGNRVNEVGWDDARNVVRDPAAAVTQGTWVVGPGRRDFQEIDVIIDHTMNVPEACFRSVVAHELGHGLGFGHSDVRGQLMFPSFNSSDPSTCPGSISAEEAAFLLNLYGQNRRPALVAPAPVSVAAGQSAVVAVDASDPEGDPLTYRWTQTSGVPVAFTPDLPTLAFTAPATAGEVLTFNFSVADRFRAASAVVTVTVEEAPEPPPGSGTFAGAFPPRGVGLVVWNGGDVGSALAAAADQGAGALFITSGGRFIGYTVGAPSFVNAGFMAAYPAGEIPAGTPMLVVVYGAGQTVRR